MPFQAGRSICLVLIIALPALAACSSAPSEPLTPEGPTAKMTMLEYAPNDPTAAGQAETTCSALGQKAHFEKNDPRPMGAVAIYKCQ